MENKEIGIVSYTAMFWESMKNQIIFVTENTKSPYFRELRWMYNITYVPSIIVITKDGNIISKKGVEEVVNHGLNVLVIWVIFIFYS